LPQSSSDALCRVDNVQGRRLAQTLRSITDRGTAEGGPGAAGGNPARLEPFAGLRAAWLCRLAGRSAAARAQQPPCPFTHQNSWGASTKTLIIGAVLRSLHNASRRGSPPALGTAGSLPLLHTGHPARGARQTAEFCGLHVDFEIEGVGTRRAAGWTACAIQDHRAARERGMEPRPSRGPVGGLALRADRGASWSWLAAAGQLSGAQVHAPGLGPWHPPRRR
jgi:hypothetical protein